MLPRTDSAVTLGEGGTPLLRLPASLGQGTPTVAAKLESLNPTLSFKDRAMALGASVALDRGLDGLVLASTGNAAVSAAAYAARAGLRCRIVCATSSEAGAKLEAARSHGAEITLIDGDYSDAYEAATRLEGDGWLNVTTTYRNPFLTEAYRTIAFELHEDLGAVPDAVVVPVGAGPLLRGVLAGFDDLLATGVTERVPRMIGVQAAACAPLVRAWQAADPASSLAAGTPLRPTVAGAIADPLRGYELEGLLTLDAVARSGGTLLAVEDAQMLDAADRLARGAGVNVEPAAAAALAALTAVEGQVLVVLLTGHGAQSDRRSAPATAMAAA